MTARYVPKSTEVQSDGRRCLRFIISAVSRCDSARCLRNRVSGEGIECGRNKVKRSVERIVPAAIESEVVGRGQWWALMEE